MAAAFWPAPVLEVPCETPPSAARADVAFIVCGAGKGLFLQAKGQIVGAVRKILAAQLGVAVIVGVGAWGVAGAVAGYSAALGGLICVIPNAYLALRMMAARSATEPRKMLRATWFGEVGKLVLTAALFAIVFAAVRPLSPGALLIGFIASQSGIWLAILGDWRALN